MADPADPQLAAARLWHFWVSGIGRSGTVSPGFSCCSQGVRSQGVHVHARTPPTCHHWTVGRTA